MQCNIDFETYSEAGYVFDGVKWVSIAKSPPHGLGAVGSSVYSEHPSTEVLCIDYDFGNGPRIWFPGLPEPTQLLNHAALGGSFIAWNSSFEYDIWNNVCVPKLGWPPIRLEQMRCTMARSRAHGLPGKLSTAGDAINAPIQKLTEGTRLINKFCKPRNPTKKDPRLRIRPEEDIVDAYKLYMYCRVDVQSEYTLGEMIPELSPVELEVWQMDQRINQRGVCVDMDAVNGLQAIVDGETERLTAELFELTGGRVSSVAELKKLSEWLSEIGSSVPSLTKEAVEDALKTVTNPQARRALEIRQALGLASVKKLVAIANRTSADGRIRGLFSYCGADRTGRFAGRGPQPQNLPNSGPDVIKCGGCGRYRDHGAGCRCGGVSINTPWNYEASNELLEWAPLHDPLDLPNHYAKPLAAVSGCLRGLFIAGPGKDLICSDYSAIEAVVLAMLAGEQWRIDVFRGHSRIYEMSASTITGVPFEEIIAHKKNTGDHHPLRKLGKVAELASGYQGSVGAWKAFGADRYLNSDEEILTAVQEWRSASPKIVNFWHGLERAAKRAIQYMGNAVGYRGVTYLSDGKVLSCKLPSGRKLHYHKPALVNALSPWGKPIVKIIYWGKCGTTGKFVQLDTYGGKLCENVVQAVARDLLTYAMVNLEKNGYTIVLHIHDEIVSEIPKGYGSGEEFEKIMMEMPAWAHGWPIKAAGVWRGKRYRKD